GPYETLGIGDRYRALLEAGLSDAEERAAREIVEGYRAHSLRPVDFGFVRPRRTRMVPNPGTAARLAAEFMGTDRRYYDEPWRTLVGRALKARRWPLYDVWLRSRLA